MPSVLQFSSVFRVVGTLLLVFTSLASSAQSITGFIRNKISGEALPFAAIGIKQKGIGTTADVNGQFSLHLKNSNLPDTLSILAVGYQELALPVKVILADKETAGSFRKTPGTNEITFFLQPKQTSLRPIEITGKVKKWKAAEVGFNMDKDITYQHEFAPKDTLIKSIPGQEIGNIIRFKKYPAHLQDFNFGLHGSGNLPVTVRLHIYSLKNNLPYKKLLPKDVVIMIPPHCTGWIKVNLKPYNITLHQDFAVVLEWINEANKLTSNSLLTFNNMPKDQITVYRESDVKPWKILPTTSIGMYVTLLYER